MESACAVDSITCGSGVVIEATTSAGNKSTSAFVIVATALCEAATFLAVTVHGVAVTGAEMGLYVGGDCWAAVVVAAPVDAGLALCTVFAFFLVKSIFTFAFDGFTTGFFLITDVDLATVATVAKCETVLEEAGSLLVGLPASCSSC